MKMPEPETPTTIYLIGGTTEANRAVRRLEAEGFDVAVSVATALGAARSAASRQRVSDTGPKDAAQMALRAMELGASAIIDCSHPYARLASSEARKASEVARLPYLRFSRPVTAVTGTGVIRAGSWGEAASILGNRCGKALLTVGTRPLVHFTGRDLEFVARILPLPESLAACNRLGIDPARILAAHPPFSVEFNRACIRHSCADILVTKDSGREGGLSQKAGAAEAEDIDLMLVDRPADPDAIYDLDRLVDALRVVLEHDSEMPSRHIP